MSNFTISDVLTDLFITLKLLLYSMYCTIELMVRNYLLPNNWVHKRIDKQIVLITGAAGGIGKSLTKNFLKLGCTVVCVDLNQEELDKLEEELNSNIKLKPLHKHVYFYNFDITNVDEVKENCKRIREEVGHVNILVNNAGIMNKAKMLLDLSENEIKNIFNVNIMSQFWMCREFLPRMIETNKGHIVNISSSLGFFGAYKLTDYCSTKFAVIGFSEALRVELKTSNPNNRIVVTTVCPFHVKTKLFNGFEMESFKWLKMSNPPEVVADQIVKGILADKNLIGCPRFELFLLAAVKNLVTTTIQDNMMIWFGFHKAINKCRST